MKLLKYYKMKRIIISAVLLLGALNVFSQIITIEKCQALAQENYPLVKQKGLINQLSENNSRSLSDRYLPQIQINGQVSYQSDVTRIELGNLPEMLQSITFPTPNKDQYKVYADVSQVIYDGGAISSQKKIISANDVVSKGEVDVELYKLRDRINQTFFGILLMDEELKQVDLLKYDLQSALDKVEVAVKNGASLKTNEQNLQAEMLSVNQQRNELIDSKQTLIKIMSVLTGQDFSDKTIFQKPEIRLVKETAIRPELSLLQYKLDAVELQNKQLTAVNMPKLSLFVQGGYANPALNMFYTGFEPYYVAGVRLNWNLSGLYTLKRDRENLNIQQQALQVQKNMFEINQRISETQQSDEIHTLEQKLKSDDELIALRADIKTTSKVQLDNGIITSGDFIRDANAENKARQAKVIHQMQLLLAQYNLQWINNQK